MVLTNPTHFALRVFVLGKFTQPQQEHPEWPHPVHHFAEKVFCFACKGVFVC
jgi:hypothetical protein